MPRVSLLVRAGVTSAAIAVTAIVASAYGQQSLHVTVRDGAKLTEVDTRSKSVKELLSEKNIDLSKMDQVSPSLVSDLTDGMTIRITRKRIDTVTEVSAIPFRVSKVYSDGMRAGTFQTVVAGSNGLKSVTFEDTFINDQCVNNADKPQYATIISHRGRCHSAATQASEAGHPGIGFEAGASAAKRRKRVPLCAGLRACT